MKRAVTAVVVLIMGAATTALAHHSYAQYDRDRTVVIAGRLDRVLFANPHVTLQLTSDDGQQYLAEWWTTNQLLRFGVVSETLKAGDYVVISGRPRRNPAEHQLSLLTEVRRPADGWAWRRPAQTPPATAPQ